MSTPKQHRYLVEFCDHDGAQRTIYIRGESNAQIRETMREYAIIVIDNTETPEKTYWGKNNER